MRKESGARNEIVTEKQDFTIKLLAIVQTLADDVSPTLRRSLPVNLDSNLDRDLGLDSLARAELISRLDKEFGVKLPDLVLVEANTPGDLLTALKQADPELGLSEPAESKYTSLELVEEPISAETIIEALLFHVRNHPDRPHLRVWISEDHQEQITYGELHDAALKVAHGLVSLGISPGDRVAIMLGSSREFFQAFFGVLYSGTIPVPIYPPFRPSQVEDHMQRQAGILRNAGVKILIISEEMQAVSSLLFDLAGDLKHIETVFGLTSNGALGKPVQADNQTVALIQYTSGSTGDPKGVVLTHANLLANIRAMGEALEAGSYDVFVSWLPLYHDMGLIGAWLGSLYYGAFAVIMPPLAFLADPSRWLRTIHHHKATLSAAPNFAFELCCKNIRKEQIDGLDLSSLRLILNGAEPVSPMTIDRFSERFAPYGFRREMMGPVYGLAENSVGLAFPPLGRAPPVNKVKRNVLSTEGRAEPADNDDPTALAFVACGHPLPRHEIRIVDDGGRELPDRYEGQLHFRGPSATAGYFRNDKKNQTLFIEGWLDSGDRAFMHKGDVFITGRVKDMIIKGGRNIYPQEIEELTGQVEGVRKGCVAAISSPDPKAGTERLVLVVETRLISDVEREVLRQRIRETCALKLEMPPDVIELVPPRSVPKTSSGKIRRGATRELYEAGLLTAKQSGLWLQLLRLWVSGLMIRIRRSGLYLFQLVYAGYWWLVLLILALITWFSVILLPRRDWRQGFVSRCSRLFLKLTGTVPEVTAEADVPGRDCIVVANHSSYLDSLVLSAALPGSLTFVAKEELARQRIAGPFLRRLGTIFVRRTGVADSVEDTAILMDTVRRGERVVTFPEASLTRMPGLFPFRLGAFLAAAQTGKPVLPVVLRGTRTVLRGEQWFPRHGHIRVWIGTPVWPGGNDFNAAVQLRDKLRTKMLEICEEPDLATERINILKPEQISGKGDGSEK